MHFRAKQMFWRVASCRLASGLEIRSPNKLALDVARKKSWDELSKNAFVKMLQAIAKQLGMATRTASTHLSNIYQKLEVHSRGELADLVREKGLLDD